MYRPYHHLLCDNSKLYLLYSYYLPIPGVLQHDYGSHRSDVWSTDGQHNGCSLWTVWRRFNGTHPGPRIAVSGSRQYPWSSYRRYIIVYSDTLCTILNVLCDGLCDIQSMIWVPDIDTWFLLIEYLQASPNPTTVLYTAGGLCIGAGQLAVLSAFRTPVTGACAKFLQVVEHERVPITESEPRPLQYNSAFVNGRSDQSEAGGWTLKGYEVYSLESMICDSDVAAISLLLLIIYFTQYWCAFTFISNSQVNQHLSRTWCVFSLLCVMEQTCYHGNTTDFEFDPQEQD